ncbi:multifunctional CCA addition/repair protein [Reinekea sp.]|uniref:multifunctional CCA addition/repair protein n=1 Tax=Reinekea sp. TaxID=1970455 RepID=UPI002A7EB490|nr:multifunctional CCA addition/repair protein [Reinekea sp.]
MQIYLVGGAVRDKLLGVATQDRDWVVVGSHPDQLKAMGYQQVGADFPVFLHPVSKEEYALARTERKTGSGYQGFTVDFDSSVTLAEDLARRDLTINAMAEDEQGQLIDPFNGQADLNKRILRHVSPAFREDPLRVLRIARFAARFHHLGFSIAEDTQHLLTAMAESGELTDLVTERVWTEMARALTETTPSEFFKVLKRVNALKTIFPELDRLFGVPQTMRWHPEVDTGIHSLKALDWARSNSDDLEVLLATLCHDLGKGLTAQDVLPSHRGHEQLGANLLPGIAKRMKWPTNPAQLAESVARYHTLCHTLPELRPATILGLLKNLNAFRQPARVEQFALACAADFYGRSGFEQFNYPQRDLLITCASACAAVQAKPFVAQGLIGKAIGEAMDLARIEVLSQLKRTWR